MNGEADQQAEALHRQCTVADLHADTFLWKRLLGYDVAKRHRSWLPGNPLLGSLDLPRLDLHVWSEEPRNRFIMVNLKKYREGEKLHSGLVLEEILPDGMVMSYQGERFLVEK